MRNSRYVLLSRKPTETLVAPPEGPIDWRVTRAVARLKPADPASEKDARFVIDVELDAAVAEAMGRLTGDNTGRCLAVLVDDHVVAAPIVREATTQQFTIDGNFTEDEAKLLAEYLSPP